MERVIHKRKKQRLFFRRLIVCICAVGIICLMATGTVAIVKGINRQIKPKEIQQSTSSASEPAAKTAVPANVEKKPTVSSFTQVDSGAPKSYFDDAVFIGDSRTEGLKNYDGLGDAQYYTMKGLMVSTVYTKPAVESDAGKVTIMQALQKKTFSKIYVMLGVNELGWSSTGKFVQEYSKMIEDIKKYQPDAKIYVQSILPVSAKKSKSDKVYNNDKITSYNEEIQKIAARENVNYLKVNTAVSDSAGFLPSGASGDGVHLNQEYCKIWCDYLRSHI